MLQNTTLRKKSFPDLPIEGSIFQKNLYADVLLQEAVSQDGHRGEADVVHRQIGRIIQGLGRIGSRRQEQRARDGNEEEEGVNITDKTHAHHHTHTYGT